MLDVNITKKLASFTLDVSLSVDKQGITAIFGRSGAGKSTLINLICGILTPDTGFIKLNDQYLASAEKKITLPIEKRQIGYVFQEPLLFPHYKIKRNLCYGMKQPCHRQFTEIVELLGLEALLNRYPSTLSGGEKQRVAIGRALLSNPKLLLMDEPLSSLDEPRKQELLPYLQRLALEIKTPILYVSHSLSEISQLAQDMIVIEKGNVLIHNKLELVWQSPLIKAWFKNKPFNNLIPVNIAPEQPQAHATMIQFGKQALWLDRSFSLLHNPKLLLSISASDIQLSHCPPQQSSIVHLLTGTILNWDTDEYNVIINIQVESHIMVCELSTFAFNQLNIKKEDKIFLQITHLSLIQN